MSERQHPADRREAILEAAIDIAGNGHLYTMTVGEVATQAACTRPLVNHYFLSLINLRANVIRWAVRNDGFPIIVQAMARDDILVRDITDKQRTGVADWVNRK